MESNGSDWPSWIVPGAAGLVLGAAAVYIVQQTSQKRSKPLILRDLAGSVEGDVITEQLSRVSAVYGEEGMKKIGGSFVIVVGLGGVGSHAANLLVRSGVGRIRIVDYDQVSLSSLNRHATATRDQVGESKALSLAAFFRKLNPSTTVEVVRDVFKAENAAQVLAGNPDFVIDAIDNRQTKTDLLAYCQRNGIRVVSCMGAGGRVDPSRVQLARLPETRNDPLCRVMRLMLRQQGVDADEIPVVYSSEKPPASLLDLNDEAADNPDEYQLLPNFRVRIMPVMGAIPAMFGMVAASYVLNTLSGKEFKPMLPIKTSAKKAKKMLCNMYISEDKVYHADRQKRLLTLADAEYLIADVFDGRCAISGVVDNLQLRRFRRNVNASRSNVVLLSDTLARRHDKNENVISDMEAIGIQKKLDDFSK